MALTRLDGAPQPPLQPRRVLTTSEISDSVVRSEQISYFFTKPVFKILGVCGALVFPWSSLGLPLIRQCRDKLSATGVEDILSMPLNVRNGPGFCNRDFTPGRQPTD